MEHLIIGETQDGGIGDISVKNSCPSIQWRKEGRDATRFENIKEMYIYIYVYLKHYEKNITEKYVEIIGSWCKIGDSGGLIEEDMTEVKEKAMKIPD